MISLSDFAKIIEDGLNETLADPDIKFKIWADVGKEVRATRTGNQVQDYILGNLRISSSANDANMLVMGVNSLTLELSVPLRRPWTNLAQTEASLEAVQEGQYIFVREIREAVDQYFQRYQIFSEKVGDITFTLAMQAGACITGNVDLAAQLNRNVTMTVNITLYYLEGGINSKDIVFEIDGSAVAVQSMTISRRGNVSSDVYSDADDTQNYLTSSAVSIDFASPANIYGATRAILSYLLEGKKNVAHFVRVKYASLSDSLYLMTFANGDTNIAGISFAGTTGSLVSTVKDVELLDFPESYQVARVSVTSSELTEIPLQATLAAGMSANLYAAKKFYALSASASGAATELNIPVTPASLPYDPESDSYFLYLVTDKAVTFTSAAGTVQVVKYAQNETENIPIPDVPDYYRVAVAEFDTPIFLSTTMSLTPYTAGPMIAYLGLGDSRTFAFEGETADGSARTLDINVSTLDFVTYPQFPGKYFLYFMTNGQCMIYSKDINFQVLQLGADRPEQPSVPDLPNLPQVSESSQIAALYLDDLGPVNMSISFILRPPSADSLQVKVGGQSYTVEGVLTVGYSRSLDAVVYAQDFVFDPSTGKYLIYIVTDTACGINALNIGETYIVKEAW